MKRGAPITLRVADRLTELTVLWRQERAAAAARTVAERAEVPLKVRVERGDALTRVEVDDVSPAPGDRTLLWLSYESKDLRIRVGDPVRLWWTDPDADDAIGGVVARRRAHRLGVMVAGDWPDRLLSSQFNLDRDDPLETFTRGERAIRAFEQAVTKSETGRLREVLFGNRTPTFQPDQPPLTLFDRALNANQRAAVGHALTAHTFALIHGPPGTGKTRTLIEVIRQAVARGDRVLACAMSNTATDHLAEGLLNAGINVVRVGHPARVAKAVCESSLDHLLEQTDAWQLARQWMAEARQLRTRANRRRDRGSLGRGDFRDMMRAARRMDQDARSQLRGAQLGILHQAEVICSTATGADGSILRNHNFDTVVLDEATQAPDPIALVPMTSTYRVIMAGDPEQLPPTVIDRSAQAGGLGHTFFEQLAERYPTAVRMLTTQYRMHASLMTFPSATRYDGRLVADPSVASHRLEDIDGVASDPLRPTPLILIDTAGKGWEDEVEAEGGSTFNTQQAERTAAEVRRLLSRGLRPEQLAVITPYNAQVRHLRQLLVSERDAGLEIGTVDGFQGREKEAIIFDTVRSNDAGKVGFVADRRRLNVALTRARRGLILIADSATLGQHADFAALLEAVEQNGAWISAWSDDAPLFD